MLPFLAVHGVIRLSRSSKMRPMRRAPEAARFTLAPLRFEVSLSWRLDEQRRGKRRSRTSSDALLLGRIFDDRGHRMTPSYAAKNGARYRYYVSCVLAQGRKHEAGSVPRVPAPE